MLSTQVRSKERVSTHAEVFTSDREVGAMLDLVKQETERLDSRFLEQACGNGNFLAEVLRRKMDVLKQRYSQSIIDADKQAIVVISSLYGIEILQDNVAECRERLYTIWNDEYSSLLGEYVNDDTRKSARFILERNIVCGDALSFKLMNPDGSPSESPIVFSEWSFVKGPLLQRRDFSYEAFVNDPSTISEKKETGKEYIQGDLFTSAESKGRLLQRCVMHYQTISQSI